MADTITLPLGTQDGKVIDTDDVGGSHKQRIKLGWGADGVYNEVDDATDKRVPTKEENSNAIKTALEIIDDWDETDRCKVNVIVGQAGITAGAGAVAANTPRVTHASDDPTVAALQIIDDWDENDRCKVNVIAGQDGVTAGAGSVAANTPRTTLASDDPAVVALQLLDDAVKTDDAGFTPATDKVLMVGAQLDDTSPDVVDEGDAGALRMNSRRSLHVVIKDNAGNERGLNVDANGAITVVSAGNTAHDDADGSTLPLKIGFKAHNALPTAVANNDRVNGVADLFGRQLTSHIDPAMQMWKQVEATSQQTGTAVWTPTSGKRIAITGYKIAFGGTTAGVFTLWFGASGDTTFTQGTDQVVIRGEAAPSTTSRPIVISPLMHPEFCVTADHVLRITTSAAMTIYITVYGYEY